MTVVPLPSKPCLRVRIIGTDDVGNDVGTRFFLSYGGSTPSGPDCAAIATFVRTTWTNDLNNMCSQNYHLTLVDVEDIASKTGLSGQDTAGSVGVRVGNLLPIQCAFNVEYGIAQRYRGGKPRGYWPFGVDSDLKDQSHWTDAFVTSVQTQVATFFAALNGMTQGSVGPFQHVLVSYYHGFKNVTNTSGRSEDVPTYKATADVYDVKSYIPKQLLSSQRRRRTATTP